MLTTRLSENQQTLILQLYRMHCRVVAGDIRVPFRDHVNRQGQVSIGWGLYRNGETRSEQASLSRTLRRLEQRGIVERFNTCSGSERRTTEVSFTADGLRFAKQLAVANWGEFSWTV